MNYSSIFTGRPKKGENSELGNQGDNITLKKGIGMQTEVAHAIINEKDDGKLLRDVLGKQGAPPGNKNAAKNKVDNINFVSKPKTKGGTSRAYILDRLQRDRPDLAAKVLGRGG